MYFPCRFQAENNRRTTAERTAKYDVPRLCCPETSGNRKLFGFTDQIRSGGWGQGQSLPGIIHHSASYQYSQSNKTASFPCCFDWRTCPHAPNARPSAQAIDEWCERSATQAASPTRHRVSYGRPSDGPAYEWQAWTAVSTT